MAKISVIVPVYNSEEYLDRCVNSLLQQSLQDIEIILVNDASTDSSLSMMEQYLNDYPEQIKIIDCKVNGKQGTARNKGLDIATGDYIGFLDSDDWVALDKYEVLYNMALENNSDIVDSDYAKAASPEEIIAELTSMPADSTDTYNNKNINELVMQPGYIWTKIYRRSFIEKYHFRFPENIFFEDNEFLPIVVAMASRIDKVEKILSYYFVNTDSTVNRTESFHIFDRLPTAINMVEKFKEFNIYNQYKDAINARFIELYYSTTISIALNKFKETPLEYLYEIRDYMKRHYPDYRTNKYFKERTTYKEKFRTKLNDINPRLLSLLHAVMRG